MDNLIDNLANDILTSLRNEEATKGNEYLGCDWMHGLLRRDNVPRGAFMRVLLTRLGESKNDARSFVLQVEDLNAKLDAEELNACLTAAASFVPEYFLMAAEHIARTFGRRLRPDLVVHYHGKHHDTFVAAGRAAMNNAVALAVPFITEITSNWQLAHTNLLPVETLVAIARKVPMSPLGVAFVSKVLLRLSPNHYAANELLGRVTNAIKESPCSPSHNAATLYRFAIMAGVELNGVGMPEWRDDNRYGTVPKAWFNNVLRHAVEQSGWAFVKPKVQYHKSDRDRFGTWTAEVGTGDDRYWYRHNAERWGDKLQPTDEVMVPTKPPPGVPRNGNNKYCDYTIGMHPVAVPTIEMIRNIK